MNKYMQEAIKLSEENLKTNNGCPFGACVVKDNVIIVKGYNNVLKDNDPTAHAEIVAIRNACKNLNSYDLSECEIYTTCYSCPMCLSAIIWTNIKKFIMEIQELMILILVLEMILYIILLKKNVMVIY